MNREMQRLQSDFERNAASYPNLRLGVFYAEGREDFEKLSFERPNHVIPLWQFMGEAAELGVEQLGHTEFGLTNPQLSAFAVLEGEKLDRFLKIAQRAGSLVPGSVAAKMDRLITENVPAVQAATKPVLVRNTNPVAVWLNLVLVAVSTYQPERFQLLRLAVDPFTASLAVFDHFFAANSPRHHPPGAEGDLRAQQFDVALSFPGERREFVGDVARRLRADEVAVFYDEFFEAELAQPDLDLLLQHVYRYKSRLIAVFLCAEYEGKEWCGLEWRAIRDLIKVRAGSTIMPLRFDDTEIPGLFSIDGYLNLRGRTPDEVADLVLERLRTSNFNEAEAVERS